MKITYEIAGSQGEWVVSRNGEPGASYVTAEAAFEVAVAQSSTEMRSDHEIVIHIRPQVKDE
jgi:hypothetical protein